MAQSEKIHQVSKGDTLSKIAAANGVTLGQLIAANPSLTGRDPSRISIGEKFVIPGATMSSSQTAGSPIAACPYGQKPKPAELKRGPVEGDDFSVSKGQITFNAEGNDNPKSPYFSRHIHWPGNEKSGVTLGRGYDMGGKSAAKVEADLIAAGVDPVRAAAFAKGAGKTGNDASKFVVENQSDLGLITPSEQKKLFENIYPKYEETAKSSYNYHKVPDAVAWDDLDGPVRDILIDFNYQGFGRMEKGYGRPMQKGMTNDPKELSDYIAGNSTMQGYEAGRGRGKYLGDAYGI